MTEPEFVEPLQTPEPEQTQQEPEETQPEPKDVEEFHAGVSTTDPLYDRDDLGES